MNEDVLPLRPAQIKPRCVKINWPNCAWLCSNAIVKPGQAPPTFVAWTGYGQDPASAYADWYRKNNGDKWKIG